MGRIKGKMSQNEGANGRNSEIQRGASKDNYWILQCGKAAALLAGTTFRRGCLEGRIEHLPTLCWIPAENMPE